jgi:hypothetical protein
MVRRSIRFLRAYGYLAARSGLHSFDVLAIGPEGGALVYVTPFIRETGGWPSEEWLDLLRQVLRPASVAVGLVGLVWRLGAQPGQMVLPSDPGLGWACVGDTSPRRANAENTIPATNAMPIRTARTTKTRNANAGFMLVTFLANSVRVRWPEDCHRHAKTVFKNAIVTGAREARGERVESLQNSRWQLQESGWRVFSS